MFRAVHGLLPEGTTIEESKKRIERTHATRLIWVGMVALGILFLFFQRRQDQSKSAPTATSVAVERPRYIIDTDAGTDDLVAIALLSSDTSVTVEAVTVVDGLSSVAAGVMNVRRLLAQLGKPDIPVIAGASRRLQETKRFPADWRTATEAAPAGLLPTINPVRLDLSADEYLAAALLRPGGRLRILALGPLTNLALALRRIAPEAVPHIPVTTMGGAFGAAGNLISFNDSTGLNRYAEWNVFSDPLAAEEVFQSQLAVTMVPLDVTNTVPVRPCLLESLRATQRGPAGEFVLGTFDQVRDWIGRGDYYAWDPLAAAVAIDAIRHAKKAQTVRVERRPGSRMGQTTSAPGGARVLVVESVDASAFSTWLLTGLQVRHERTAAGCR